MTDVVIYDIVITSPPLEHTSNHPIGVRRPPTAAAAATTTFCQRAVRQHNLKPTIFYYFFPSCVIHYFSLVSSDFHVFARFSRTFQRDSQPTSEIHPSSRDSTTMVSTASCFVYGLANGERPIIVLNRARALCENSRLKSSK